MKMKTYSHRNGEDEAPTIDGYYFFTGEVSGTNAFGKYVRQIRKLVKVAGNSVDFGGIDDAYTSNANGQWWGPVTPPWEEDNA